MKPVHVIPSDPERAARMDTPDLGSWDDMLPEPGGHPLLKIIALNIPPAALLAAAAHVGLLDGFLDPAIGASCSLVALPALVGILATVRRAWLGEPTADIREYSGWAMTLGLIGTVLGFIIALSGVDPAKVSDLSTMTPMVATMLVGMSIALHTTLVGAVGGLWLRYVLRFVR